MSDDVVIDGSPVRADLVSGSYFQIVKLDLGGDGLSVPVIGAVPISVSSDPSQGTDGAVPPAKVVAIGGTDGTNLQLIKVDATGIVQVAQNGNITVTSDGASTFKTQTDDLNGATTLITSGAYTATQTSADQQNDRWRGLRLHLNVTVAPTGTPETLTVSLETKDTVSANYFKISNWISSGAANAGGYASMPTQFVFEYYPGSTNPTIANYQAQSNVLPFKWRAKITHSAASPWTYSLGASLIR